MHIYTIYRATNTINGKVYIGFDSAWPTRKRGHKSSANVQPKSKFHKAIRKYGWDSFIWEPIYQSMEYVHCLNTMEPFFIIEHDSLASGYNSTYGGEGGVYEGQVGSKRPEFAQKISQILKGRPNPRKGLPSGQKGRPGRPVSDESKLKISQSKLGKPRSEETKTKLRSAMKGRKGHIASAETRLKISQKLKNLDRVMICRIHDRKVMDIHHYSRWANQTSIYCNLNQSAIDSCPV